MTTPIATTSQPLGTPAVAPVPAPTATPHAIETYTPLATPERRGIALCLSGGGYRATLFHLGAIRRLHELGIFAQLDEVTSVSGGSITSAVLARALVRGAAAGRTEITDFDAEVARPIRDLTRRNIRTPAMLRRWLPWNWFRDDTGVRALAQAYRTSFADFACSALPTRPDFVFCATDMAFGVSWTFRRDQMGDYQAGGMAPRPEDDVAEAVAASSCFPPVFNPLRLHLDPDKLPLGAYRGPDRAKSVRGLRLTDGGNYDNLGLEPAWQRRAVVLVSDGGGPFEQSADQGLFWRVQRYTDILYKQVGALRKRWLISNFVAGVLRGTYWGVASDVSNYDPTAPGYPADVAHDLIARIRTDLDAFSDAEAAVLENHGYALTDAAIRHHLLTLIARSAPFRVPHPEWDWTRLDVVRRALADSHKRTLLGRS
jgi:NTE family protein